MLIDDIRRHWSSNAENANLSKFFIYNYLKTLGTALLCEIIYILINKYCL